METVIFTVFTTFGGAVLTYLLKENFELKKKVEELTNNLLGLVIAIKDSKEIPNNSILNQKADEIINILQKKK